MGMDSDRYSKLWLLLRSLPENTSKHFETCPRLAFLLQWGRGGCTVWERHRLDTAALLPRGETVGHGGWGLGVHSARDLNISETFNGKTDMAENKIARTFSSGKPKVGTCPLV